jgi:hypothetical protein
VRGEFRTLWLSNLDDYVASLHSLADLEIDVLLHGRAAPSSAAAAPVHG